MEMPNYDGILKSWVVELVIEQARKLKVQQHDVADALQELALELMNFEYDPNNEQGATEQTVLTTIINRRLWKIKRLQKRHQDLLERRNEEFEEAYEDEKALLKLDVIDAVAKLPLQERKVCLYLADGMTTSEIAKKLRCSWHKIERIIDDIHGYFKSLGLHKWVIK